MNAPTLKPLRTLRAGPVELLYGAGEVRRLRLGGREVVRAIYAAVRDRNWGTVPMQLESEELEDDGDSFRITFTARHRREDVDFSWQGSLEGHTDGSLRYGFDGEAMTSFLRNRIGFCVLHPIRECAGAACRLEHTQGDCGPGKDSRSELTVFPEFIAPHQPFLDLASMAHEAYPGLWARLEFAGDVFETEDQRNWTDASFKTYCTPLALPFPVHITRGTRVLQEVRLKWELTDRPAEAADLEARLPSSTIAERPLVQVDWKVGLLMGQMGGGEVSHAAGMGRLPRLGMCLPAPPPLPSQPSLPGPGDSQLDPLPDPFRLPSPRTIKLLRALAPDHLRLDLHPGLPGWEARLEWAHRYAWAVGALLQLALILPDPGPGQEFSVLEQVIAACDRLNIKPAQVLILPEKRSAATSDSLSSRAARLLRGKWEQGAESARWDITPGSEALVLGGTDANYAELNRHAPTAALLDGLCFSANPQVHAFDDLTLAENLEGLGEAVRSAKRLSGGKPVLISPLSLKPRFNAVATSPEAEAQADPRQMRLFGAAWTLGAIATLAEAGCAAATLYETSGRQGLLMEAMESIEGVESWESVEIAEEIPSAATEDSIFPSGTVFPLYHVLRDLAEAGPLATVLPGGKGERLSSPFFNALLLKPGHAAGAGPGHAPLEAKPGSLMLLASNLSPEPLIIDVEGPEAEAKMRLLAVGEVGRAMEDPELWRAEAWRPVGIASPNRRFTVELPAHAYLRIDWDETT